MHQHYSFTKGQKTLKSYEQVVDKVYQLAFQQQKQLNVALSEPLLLQ